MMKNKVVNPCLYLATALLLFILIDNPAKKVLASEQEYRESINDMYLNAKDRGFLWKATKGDKTFWLYGSLHYGKLIWDFPGPQTTSALKDSKTVALETDFISASKEAIRQPYKSDVENKIRDTKYFKIINTICAKESNNMCRDSDSLPMKVSYIQINSLNNIGIKPEFGIDYSIFGFAQALRKNIAFLESASDQRKAMYSLYMSEYGSNFSKIIKDYISGRNRSINERISSCWETSDAQCAEKLYLEFFVSRVRYYNIDLEKYRNTYIYNKIVDIDYDNHSTIFVAIGFFHFFGPNSIINSFRMSGFSIKRVF